MDIRAVREVNDEIQEAVSSGHAEGISSVLLKLLSDLDHAVQADDQKPQARSVALRLVSLEQLESALDEVLPPYGTRFKKPILDALDA